MGFLDSTSVTVDAILTKRGRELLAKGEGEFKITRFSLSDDEVDYGLYDTTHPNGSNFYGAVIENISLLEAFPSGKVQYFLINGEGNVTGVINMDTSARTYNSGQIDVFTPSTQNVTDDAYIFTLGNSTLGTLIGQGTGGTGEGDSSEGGEVTVRGSACRFTAANNLEKDYTSIITIMGVTSRATATINITAKKRHVAV
jgi:hypothetical protein